MRRDGSRASARVAVSPRVVAGGDEESGDVTPKSITVVVLAALALGGCSSEPKSGYYGTTSPRHSPNVLWTNNGTEPEYIDPGKCSDSAGGFVARNLFAGLTQPHPKTLEPMPDIAAGWEVSDGGRVYTFYLRQTAWSDGHPVTAEDFEYAWKRVLDPKTGSKYANYLYMLRGGEAFNRRALRVTGLPQEIGAGEVEALFAKQVPVARVELREQPRAAYVYVDATQESGADKAARARERRQNRERARRYFDGRTVTFPARPSGAAAGSEQTLEAKAQTARNDAEPAAAQGSGRAASSGADGPSGDTETNARGDSMRAAAATLKVRVADASVVGVDALDERILRVTLRNPLPYFLDAIHFYTTLPVPKHVIESLEQDGKNPDLWTRPEHIVTNGAFTLSEWKFRQYMRFEKNPRYWDADRVKLDAVKVLMVQNANTSLNLYEAGHVDWNGQNSSLPNEFMAHLEEFEDFHRSPYLGVYFYWFNTEAEVVKDPRVRKALSLAVDREAVVEHVTQGGQIPSATLVPEGLGGYEALDEPLFAPDKARQLLAEAGYPDGAGIGDITLIYNTSEGHKQIAQAVQQMWRKHLGIRVNIENQEWKVYLKNLAMMEFQIARMGWIGDYPDPYTFLGLVSGSSGNNHSNWSSERYDALLRQANATADPQERLQMLRRAEKLMLAAQPLLPIYTYTRSDMWKPYLRGLWSNVQNIHPLKWISIAANCCAERDPATVPNPVPEHIEPRIPKALRAHTAAANADDQE